MLFRRRLNGQVRRHLGKLPPVVDPVVGASRRGPLFQNDRRQLRYFSAESMKLLHAAARGHRDQRKLMAASQCDDRCHAYQGKTGPSAIRQDIEA
jgi:hypothetical protein